MIQVIIDGQAPSHAEPHYRGKLHPPMMIVAEFGSRDVSWLGRKEESYLGKQIGLWSKVLPPITIMFAAATSFNGFNKNPFTDGKDEKALCSQYIDHVKSKSFEELYQRHVSDYSVVIRQGKPLILEIPRNHPCR